MRFVKTTFSGALIGIANIIPGVSGGTVALMLGIYQRILNAIHHISSHTVKALVCLCVGRPNAWQNLVDEMKRIDAAFLAALALGALVAVLLTAELMAFLLHAYHDPTYGFFFGLVLLSAVTPLTLIKKKNFLCLGAAVLGIVCVVLVANAMSRDTIVKKAEIGIEQVEHAASSAQPDVVTSDPEKHRSVIFLGYVFLLGFVAISAMILPGVSGSFLLLLLGGYFTILEAISNRNMLVLGVFGIGCAAGLVLFSRFINFLLRRWYDATMSFLLGLVLGSLWILWPFKTTQRVGSETVYLDNLVPEVWSTNEWMTLLAAGTGAAFVAAFFWVERAHKKRHQSE